MDVTGRKITKIARELNKLVISHMKHEELGISELDMIHLIRHNPGIQQKDICESLNMDKGGVAKRVASLENKGYLTRVQDEKDRRAQHIFATEKAETLKGSKAHIEAVFYEWLLSDLTDEEKQTFAVILDKIYIKSKTQSRQGFPDVNAILEAESEKS